MTGINRRQFNLLLATGLVSPGLLAQNKAYFASAAQTAPNQYELVVANDLGQLLHRHSLPARAHQIASHPFQPWLAAIARRPGRFIDVVDYQEQRLLKRIHSPKDQHFFGHAIFSGDGRYLYSTENQISQGQGLISIRDCDNDFNLVAQFSSGGIGPHELMLMPDQQTLVIANGGILTHPDQGRKKLNLDTMRPSLAYIDSQSGELLEKVSFEPALHQLSIRHLDINAEGRVAIAMQYQGEQIDDVPLVAFHQRGGNLQAVQAPLATNRAMKQYCGSVKFDCSGEFVAVSSPRGDLITFWHASSAEFLDSISCRDACGISPDTTPARFIVTNGHGRVYQLDLNKGSRTKLSSLPQFSWDNHLSSLT